MKKILRRALSATGLERPVRAGLWRARHFGLRCECPLCHGRLKRFLTDGEDHAVLRELEVVGGGYRDNMTCPFCYAIDRERLLFLFLRNRPELLAGRPRLLHAMPEPALEAWLRSLGNLEYVSCDLQSPKVDVLLDLTAIPFAEASFDAVLCNHVMEHIPDDGLAMREILRVLRPGGWAIMQVPIARKLDKTVEDPTVADPAERQRRFGQDDHVRIYAAEDYRARLTSAGFTLEEFSWEEHPTQFGGATNRYGLLPHERLFFMRRPPATVAAASKAAAAV